MEKVCNFALDYIYNIFLSTDEDGVDASRSKITEKMVRGFRNEDQRDWEDDVNDPIEKAMLKMNFSDQRSPFPGKLKKKNFNDEIDGDDDDDNASGLSTRSTSPTSHFSDDESRLIGRRCNNRRFRNSSYGNISSDSGSNESFISDRTEFSSKGMRKKRKKLELTAPNLAKCLSKFDDFEATLLQLFDKNRFHYNHVEQIALRNQNTFEIDEEIVRLRPKVKLCSAHTDDEGCHDPDSCDSIHICPNFSFKSQAFSYLLDLGKMIQTNQKTNVVRTVRRRPQPHFKEKRNETDLPHQWEPMKTEERYKRVILQSSSDEYKKMHKFVLTRANGNKYNIVKIERIQNPYIFRAFQNKVEEMKMIYKKDTTIDIQQLFHGTGPDIVSKICGENFDWRLHGTSTGQLYGRGTYFARDSSYSYDYAETDANGHRYMFVAKVAVGTLTQGNSGMTRPPINVQYDIPYDSTVNDVGNPSIIVKYDKQEYYPEYIVTFG